MDFRRNLVDIGAFLDESGHPWALVGALALSAYGIARTTVDLDLLTETEAQETLVAFLAELGYETLHRSRGYSNHLHPDAGRGRVDVLYVGRDTRERLFASARRLPGPEGTEILVPKPEHLVAMKVQAMKNDPSRTFQDLADIRQLLTLPGINPEEVRGYFEKHDLSHRYEEITRLG